LGELQKRIEDAYNWVMNEKPKQGRCLYNPPTYVLAQAKKAIEEMRNEFLNVEEVELPLKVNGKVDWKKTAELMELRNIIRLKWFRRWLAKKSGTN